MSKSDVDRYYERMLEPDELRKRGQTAQALATALALTTLVPSMIKETVTQYGRFDLSSIPPIETGCVLAAVLGDADALDKFESVVNAHHELAAWREAVDGGRRDMMLVTAIRAHLSSNPGAIQSELGRTLGCEGREASRLVGYMNQAGQVRRDKSGRSYALFLSGSS